MDLIWREGSDNIPRQLEVLKPELSVDVRTVISLQEVGKCNFLHYKALWKWKPVGLQLYCCCTDILISFLSKQYVAHDGNSLYTVQVKQFTLQKTYNQMYRS